MTTREPEEPAMNDDLARQPASGPAADSLSA